MQTKWSLTLAQYVKNDEFYTPKYLAKELIDPFKEQLVGKRNMSMRWWNKPDLALFERIRPKCRKSK